jgi:orotidine-5'-phosphate decarboxylase
VRNGADYLVMGRQITRAQDPAAEAARVLEEIAAA